MVQLHDSVKRGSARLADVCDAIVSVLFPADCRLCEGLLTRASRVPICDTCLASFEPLQGRTCETCSATFSGFVRSNGAGHRKRKRSGVGRRICRVCTSRPYAFERARSYARYQEALVRAIVTLKFECIEPLGKWFACRLAELVKREPERLQPISWYQYPCTADLPGKPLARLLGPPYRAVL